MTYRLLLDENVEHEVAERLAAEGHDVEHVDFVADLGKGTTDTEIGEYSRAENRLVVTYDDDFVLELEESAFRGVLYVADAAIDGADLVGAIGRMARQYPQAEVMGVEYLDRWC